MSSNPSTNHSPGALLPDARNAFGFPTGEHTSQESPRPVPAQPNAKGDTVLLFLKNKMLQLRADELTMCRIAHIWAFGTDPDLTDDARLLRDHGVIPPYLRSYLKTLQG